MYRGIRLDDQKPESLTDLLTLLDAEEDLQYRIWCVEYLTANQDFYN